MPPPALWLMGVELTFLPEGLFFRTVCYVSGQEGWKEANAFLKARVE